MMDRKYLYRRLEKYQHEGADTVKTVEAGKVFHVVEGRNAWHSTWVSRYKPNSFYSSLSSAKSYAESIRKSGSVFTILEKPGLVIRSVKKTTIVVEVNHGKPLAGHIIDQDFENIKDATAADYRQRSEFLPDFIKGFMSTSLGWRRKVSANNMIILQHKNPGLKIKGVSNPLKARVSVSRGSGYYLLWNESDYSTNSGSVCKISDNFKCLFEESVITGGHVNSLDDERRKDIKNLEFQIIQQIKKKTNLDEKVQQSFAETFLDELREAYSERAIISADVKDILELNLDWLGSLGRFSPEDRKEILSREAIKNSKLPFRYAGV